MRPRASERISIGRALRSVRSGSGAHPLVIRCVRRRPARQRPSARWLLAQPPLTDESLGARLRVGRPMNLIRRPCPSSACHANNANIARQRSNSPTTDDPRLSDTGDPKSGPAGRSCTRVANGEQRRASASSTNNTRLAGARYCSQAKMQPVINAAIRKRTHAARFDDRTATTGHDEIVAFAIKPECDGPPVPIPYVGRPRINNRQQAPPNGTAKKRKPKGNGKPARPAQSDTVNAVAMTMPIAANA